MTTLAPGIYGPKRGLLAYYTLDDRYTSGSTAIDTTTDNNNGSISGATTGVSAQVGEGYNFDGVDDQVTLPNLGISGNTSVTVSLWHRPDTDAGTDGNIPFGFGERGTNGAVFAMNMRGDGDLRIFFWGNNLGASVANFYGTWTHFVARYDASTGERSIWYDGSQVASDTPPTPSFADMAYGIGSMDGNNWYKGNIDEVRVFDRALSSTEITELFNEV